MRVLVIFAHPLEDSYAAVLRNVVVQTLSASVGLVDNLGHHFMLAPSSFHCRFTERVHNEAGDSVGRSRYPTNIRKRARVLPAPAQSDLIG